MSGLHTPDRDRQARLLADELRAQQQAFDEILDTPAIQLREQRQLFLARFHGVQEEQGNLVLWFSDYGLPRRHSLLTAFVAFNQAHLNPAGWSALPYRQLRDNANYPTELSFLTIWKAQSDAQGRPGYLLLFRGATPELIDLLRRHPQSLVCLGPPEPPLAYLSNLRDVVLRLPSDSAAGRWLDLALDTSNWNPQPVKYAPDNYLTIAATLATHNEVVVQGPPGTGKTHLMATLAAQFLAQGKSVLATALTNRALLELAEKEPLALARKQQRVFKSNLSEDERRAAPGLLSAQDYEVSPGTLLLNTYFTMSDRARKQAEAGLFDVVIIEEASQAFLPTLATARSLGQQCLVVGDPAQLPPILTIEIGNSQPALAAVRDGLLTLCQYAPLPTLLLTDTFRLTHRAASYTNRFYGGHLRSVSPLPLPLHTASNSRFAPWFHPEGGPTLQLAAMANGQVQVPLAVKQLLKGAIQAVLVNQPDAQIAVLTFYVAAVTDLQTALHDLPPSKHLVLIESVSRVQGLTVDVCFFIIPHDRIARPLNQHVFNVATSRARQHTIIITDATILTYRTLHPSVSSYLQALYIDSREHE
jgi:DNA replication ATP-dependent helicase Dna2